MQKFRVALGMLLITQLKGQHSDPDIKELLPYLSAYIRQANERGERVVLDDNWRDFALAHKNTPFFSKGWKTAGATCPAFQFRTRGAHQIRIGQ